MSAVPLPQRNYTTGCGRIPPIISNHPCINRVPDDFEFENEVDYPDGNVVHIGIGKSARWLVLIIKSCMFQKFCFLRFRSNFSFWCAAPLNFAFAVRRVPRRPRLWPFACAFETPCLTIVESFRAVGCYCDHLFFSSLYDRQIYSILFCGASTYSSNDIY